MLDEIISYREMCDRENIQTLQRGMNFHLNPNYSVILMSQRSNAPYDDEVLSDGLTIRYEGHDAPKSPETQDPKTLNQPRYTKHGKPTQNGLFILAVEQFKTTGVSEIVKIYEKLLSGVWSYKGLFDLVEYEFVASGGRNVFKFHLRLSSAQDLPRGQKLKSRSRVIPTSVKKEVWERDGGKCVKCGATDELHFDHDLPFAKGGTSITAANVKILCARHNLSKSDKIE